MATVGDWSKANFYRRVASSMSIGNDQRPASVGKQRARAHWPLALLEACVCHWLIDLASSEQ